MAVGTFWVGWRRQPHPSPIAPRRQHRQGHSDNSDRTSERSGDVVVVVGGRVTLEVQGDESTGFAAVSIRIEASQVV